MESTTGGGSAENDGAGERQGLIVMERGIPECQEQALVQGDLGGGGREGLAVEELDQEKLTPLLRLKYHDSIADAVADLGKPEEIGKVFAGFQKYLYQEGRLHE